MVKLKRLELELIACSLGCLNRRLLREDLVDLLLRRKCRRDRIRDPSEHFHRPYRVLAVSNKRRELTERDLFPDHQHASEKDRGNGQEPRNHCKYGIVAYPLQRHLHIEVIIGLVVSEELPDLELFTREGLYHAYSREVFLRYGIHFCVLFTDVVIDLVQLLLKDDRQHAADRQRNHREKRELPADPEHEEQNHRGMEHDLDREHTDVAERRLNLLHVAGHTRHDLTCIGLVKEINSELLDVLHQLLSDI